MQNDNNFRISKDLETAYKENKLFKNSLNNYTGLL